MKKLKNEIVVTAELNICCQYHTCAPNEHSCYSIEVEDICLCRLFT